MNQIVQHRQLHEVIAERVRTAILDGRFRPGQWLRLQRIADDLGVSQIPVREALKRLVAEGVVEHVPNFTSSSTRPAGVTTWCMPSTSSGRRFPPS
jgi:DNA-binding GntR family transcriptional regulator